MKKQLKQCLNLLVLLFKLIAYFLIFWIFYRAFAIENWQLLGVNRTSVVTTISYLLSGYLFLSIYGSYDIGKRKSRPIIISLCLAAAMTDAVAYIYAGATVAPYNRLYTSGYSYRALRIWRKLDIFQDI